MVDIDISSQSLLVKRMVASYIDAKVEIVDDIAEWCAANSGGAVVK